MPWLRGGTVSVTNGSTAVTGVNTGFDANARVGDSFIGPDGANYEVSNVASATVISILPPYKGVNVSGSPYAIMPVQGYSKTLADAFNTLRLQFGDKMAALGTTGNYDILPLAKGGTGVAAASNAALLTAIGAMPIGGTLAQTYFNSVRLASSANYSLGQGSYVGWNDPGDGSGLSGHMAFTCNKGGGGGGFSWRSVNLDNTQGSPTMTYRYDGYLNVPVGIQIAGVNIIERGSNANGEYVRYSDGTQICWHRLGFGPTTANANVSISWTSPMGFINLAAVQVFTTLQYAESNDNFTIARLNGNMGNNSVAGITCNFSVSQVYRIGLLAIGRWK